MPGEFVAIVGQSGSGKSTLMNILGCLDRPTTGSYRFMGEDVSAFGRDELARLRREAFGFVFQSYNLIGGASATENVEIPAIYAGHGAGRAPRARRAAADHARACPTGSSTSPTSSRAASSSASSIARALMNGGQIILADEPTGALDSKSGVEVLALLNELSRKGHTVIVITHSQEVAAHAHRVIEIRDGVIVSDPRARSATSMRRRSCNAPQGPTAGSAVRLRRSRQSRGARCARTSFAPRSRCSASSSASAR